MGMEQENKYQLENEPSPHRRKWLFLVIASPIIFVILAYGLIAYAAQDYSLPFVKYQGKDVGLKSFAEITKIVLKSESDIKKQSLTVSFDGKRETKTLDELGISIQSSKTSDSIFNYGKKSLFISLPSFTYIKSIATGRAIAPIDIKKSSETEKKLSDLFENSRKDSTNASVGVVNNNLVINKEEAGYKIDAIDFERQVESRLNTGINQIIALNKVTTSANYSANDLERFRADMEALISKNLYLQSDTKKMQVKKDELLKFVDLEMTVLNQKLTLSDKAIEDYLNSVSNYFNVKGRTKKVSSIDNSVIDEGSESKSLDIQKSTTNIREALDSNLKVATLEVTTSPIKEEVISPGYNPGKYPGKFIEVNLSQQMLYTFEGTNLIGSYRVSTGKWSMPTPQGEYTINDKNARAYSSRYDLYMPYWMAFIGSEYGIHELPEWANGTKEGEAHLGTPVSHGCVRLGRGSAEEVYNWTDVGTPVFIHK